jgi:hypothetical protein
MARRGVAAVEIGQLVFLPVVDPIANTLARSRAGCTIFRFETGEHEDHRPRPEPAGSARPACPRGHPAPAVSPH